MIVDTMSLLEVAEELLKDLKSEGIGKIVKRLKDKKYRKYIIKNGQSKKMIYFKSFDIETRRRNRFVVLPFCKGKSGFKKWGMGGIVVSLFYYEKYPYIAWVTNDFTSIVFFKKHLFERYNQRFVQDEMTFSKDLIFDYFRGNMLLCADHQHEDGSNGIVGVVRDGVLFGERLNDSAIVYKTYITADMLREEQMGKYKKLYAMYCDNMRKLEEVGMAA